MRTSMQTIISAAFGVAFLTLPVLSDEQPRLAGLWRLSAFYAENIDTKARTHTYGERPIGFMGINVEGGFDAWAMSDWPGRHMINSAPAPSIWEKAAQSLPQYAAGYRAILYSGRLRPEEGALIVGIDKAEHVGFYPEHFHVLWNEFQTRTDEVRSFRIKRDEVGNEILYIETAPFVDPNGTRNQFVGTATWVRSHEWDETGVR